LLTHAGAWNVVTTDVLSRRAVISIRSIIEPRRIMR